MKSQTERKLRFAVLLDEWRLTFWQVECISLLVKSGLCQLELMIALMPTWWRRLFLRRRGVLRHSLWFVFLATLGRAQTNKKVTRNPFSASRLTIRVADTRDVFPVASPDLASVRERRLDFILYFGSNILEAGMLGLAHHGVWTFRFGDLARSGGYPPVLWEMLQREAVTSVALEQYTHDDAKPRTVLRRGFFPITRHSYARSLDVALSGSADFPLLACQELLANGALGPQTHIYAEKV